MNPEAKAFVPKWLLPGTAPKSSGGKLRYSRQQLKALRGSAIESVRKGPVTDSPPFQHVPLSLLPYLKVRNFVEFVDIDAASALVESTPAAGPHQHLQRDEDAAAVDFYCVECAQGGQKPCRSMADVIAAVRHREQATHLGAFLFQPGDVIMGLVQLMLIFDCKRSSLRMRKLKERFPTVVALVRDFLCGDGFHIAPPPVTAHEQWRILGQMLKFDYVRDSKTVVYTELSRYWKKSHTQFEQFAHFLFFRDDIPPQRTKNMITHAQKPVIVAALTGDVNALVMLCELGFFVPPDYYWSFPFFRHVTYDRKLYSVLRHLCVYYYGRQAKRGATMVEPISPPLPSVAQPPRTALEALVGHPVLQQ